MIFHQSIKQCNCIRNTPLLYWFVRLVTELREELFIEVSKRTNSIRNSPLLPMIPHKLNDQAFHNPGLKALFRASFAALQAA